MNISSLILILFIHALALVVPGPDFAIVTKLSAVNGRKSGLMAALGVATAIGLYVVTCALGLSVIFSTRPFFAICISYAGSLYLLWIGIQCLLSKGELPAQNVQLNKSKAYFTGFLTNILNPKALLYFSSILPQALKPHTSVLDTLVVTLLLVLESLLWFSLVAFVFSSDRFLFWMQGRLVWFERFVGVVFIALAVHLALAA